METAGVANPRSSAGVSTILGTDSPCTWFTKHKSDLHFSYTCWIHPRNIPSLNNAHSFENKHAARKNNSAHEIDISASTFSAYELNTEVEFFAVSLAEPREEPLTEPLVELLVDPLTDPLADPLVGFRNDGRFCDALGTGGDEAPMIDGPRDSRPTIASSMRFATRNAWHNPCNWTWRWSLLHSRGRDTSPGIERPENSTRKVHSQHCLYNVQIWHTLNAVREPCKALGRGVPGWSSKTESEMKPAVAPWCLPSCTGTAVRMQASDPPPPRAPPLWGTHAPGCRIQCADPAAHNRNPSPQCAKHQHPRGHSHTQRETYR